MMVTRMGYWHKLRARKLQRIISRLHEIMWLLQPEGSAVLSMAEGDAKLTLAEVSAPPAPARLEGGGAAAASGAPALGVEAAAAAAAAAAAEVEVEAEANAEAEAEVARGGYRAAAAARLAAARSDARSSIRVGAEDLMSVLNQVAIITMAVSYSSWL